MDINMDLKIFAGFASPLITIFITFFLNKYFYNRPKLIAYYGNISAHKIPVNTGYGINIMLSKIEPCKSQLDIFFREKIPLLIKYQDKIFIYGFDYDGSTQLKISSNPEVYDHLHFNEEIFFLTYPTHQMYEAISANEAHTHFIYIHTHEIIVRNSGNLPAKNVKVGHQFLPDYNVMPKIAYEVADLPGGGKSINFPILVPKEQVTISYLYRPPRVWSEINRTVKSDEGFAKILEVIPTPTLKAWQKCAIYALLFIGCWSTIYMIIIFIAIIIIK